MENVQDVAAAFLARLGETTPMKLEKLVYYAQAWSLARDHEKLIGDPIEAWIDGPVVDALFQRHRKRRNISTWPWGDDKALSPRAASIVDSVVRRYGHLSGDDLSVLTHEERPWSDARRGMLSEDRSRRVIDPVLMEAFYARQALDADDSVRHAFANAALEGLQPDPAFDVQLKAVASGELSAEALIAELDAHYARIE